MTVLSGDLRTHIAHVSQSCCQQELSATPLSATAISHTSISHTAISHTAISHTAISNSYLTAISHTYQPKLPADPTLKKGVPIEAQCPPSNRAPGVTVCEGSAVPPPRTGLGRQTKCFQLGQLVGLASSFSTWGLGIITCASWLPLAVLTRATTV